MRNVTWPRGARSGSQWSYYQAKSIKQNLYEGLRELAPREPETEEKAAATAFSAKIAKYEAEKAEILKQAKQLEAERDAARMAADQASARGRQMGAAVSIFQIAIALGSICLVTKKRPLWYLSLAFAAAATFKMLELGWK